MAVYIIDFSDPSKASFTVAPGTVDGPGNSNYHTELKLPGSGVLEYGELMNENLIKLLENFASPEDIGNPGNPDPSIINKPIEGQLWFNNTSGTLFHFNGTEWKKLGGVHVGTSAPATPDEGDLWYDTNVPQLKIFNGTSWDSVASRYLELAGGTMTNYLFFDGGHSSIRYHDGFGNFQMAAGMTAVFQGDPDNNSYLTLNDPPIRWITNYEAANGGVVDDYSWAQLSLYPTAASVGKVAGDPIDLLDAVNYQFTRTFMHVDGAQIAGVAEPTGPTHAATKNYVDNAIGTAAHLELSGGTMTGYITLHAHPINNFHPATKQYVDDLVSGLSGGSGNLAVINPGAAEKDGDIRVTGSVVEMRSAGIWRQVYPAVYS